MRNYDLTPLYRTAIGFDRLASMLDKASRADQNQPGYPPYNIQLTGEDSYRITMAVAGFDSSELSITVHENNLMVSASQNTTEPAYEYLHQGIASRNFERKFHLADYVSVEGASMENGLLHIELRRELPEEVKPRSIEITDGNRSFVVGENPSNVGASVKVA